MDASPVSGGALALSPAAVGGRRHKLKLVTKKKARKVLKKLGLKMRGGMDAAPADAAVALPEPVVKAGGGDDMVAAAPTAPPAAGRRRKTRKGRRASRRSIFGY